jgi:TonB family protein
MPTQTGGSLDARERRICARHQVKSLAYLDIGADNGGIVLNLSEGGVAVHAVSVLPPDPLIDLRLQLPRSSKRLETKGKVAWTSSTKKEAGIEFIGLTDEVRLEIREWLALENLEPVYLERGPAAEPTTRRPVRKDKWTNLVSEWTSVPKGIERVTDDQTVSTRPVTVAESVPREEMVTPATGPNAAAASEEPVASTQPRDYGVAGSLIADEREPSAESNSITTSDLIDSAFSPNPGVIGNLEHRKSDAELSLPSDKLLNSPVHPISIISSRGNKTDNSKGSRNLREAGSDAANGDDFLKKARALFGPQDLHEISAEVNNSASSLKSVETAPAELSSAKGSTQEHGRPTPMSDLIASSTSSVEPLTSNALHTVAALTLDPAVPRGEEAPHQPAALPTARNLNARSLLTMLALCLSLSVVCIGLGIVVGRTFGTHSQNAVASRKDVAEQPAKIAASQAPIAPISNQTTRVAPRAKGPNQSHNQASARDQRPPAEATFPRKASAVGPNETSSASSPGGTNDTTGNATQPQAAASGGGVSLAPTANVSSTGAPTAPAPAPSPTPSAPEFHVTPAAEPKAAPHTQPPPSDRLLPAYLIYRVEPIYPRTALGIEGTVKIHATVGRDGIVKNLKIVSGPPPLSAAALDAAQFWRYIPALRNGEPVETEADISIEFHRPR